MTNGSLRMIFILIPAEKDRRQKLADYPCEALALPRFWTSRV